MRNDRKPYLFNQMIHTQYTCFELPSITSKEQLIDTLKVYANQILSMTAVEEGTIFQYLQDEVAEQGTEQAIQETTEKLLKYIDIEHISSQGASIVVEAHYEGDNDDYDLCEAISKFFFSQTSEPYFLMRSAAADRDGSYSHQWVGYWSNGEVVVEKTESYFDRLFKSGVHQQAVLVS